MDIISDKGVSAYATRNERAGGSDLPNVRQSERLGSAITGAVLLSFGLSRRPSFGSLLMAALGGELLYRGISGRCVVYRALGIDTARADRRKPSVKRSITIGQSADRLYNSWRDPNRLAQIMAHFAEVTETGEERQHWKLKLPKWGNVEWDARILEDRPGEVLRWSSVGTTRFPNQGSIHFRPAPSDWGTEVTLDMHFEPLGGTLGAAATKLLGFVPEMIAEKALRRFKSLVEAGEVASLERNPAAR